MKIKKLLILVPLILGSLVAIGIIGLWGISMPVRSLPEPTGPYGVGTISYDFVDSARNEHYAEDGGNKTPRRIRLQLWYPAVKQELKGRPEPWMPDGIRQVRGVVKTHRYPVFIWDQTIFMRSNSYPLAEPAAYAVGDQVEDQVEDQVDSLPDFSGFPVILISHGWQGYRGLHSDAAEELASYGYIVAAADHTYGAAAVLFDDGTLIRASSRVLPGRQETDRFLEYAWTLVNTFSDDNKAILKHLRTIDNGNPEQGPAFLEQLQGLLDLDRIGLVGHSTGGGAMVDLVLDSQNSQNSHRSQTTLCCHCLLPLNNPSRP